jgi:hypothetical protein
MKAVAAGSEETDRAFSLINNVVTNRRNALLIKNSSHHIMVKLLGKLLMECNIICQNMNKMRTS